MIRAKTPIALIIILALSILTISVNAEVPQKINYQGRLTDDVGNPINGSVSINFKIFANDIDTGDSVWSSGSQLVQVTDGLFTYELGSAEPIPANIFHESQLYLSISVGNDPELLRHQLITVPYAFSSINSDTAHYAKNISGVVSTQPGTMLINNEIGDSAIVLSSDIASNLSRIYMIDPGDDGKLLELVGNQETNEAGIHLIDPGDDGHTISLTSALNAGSFKMFNPQPEPPAVLFEMNASTESGATLNIYDDIGQVMGFEPSPFNEGYVMKLIDPGDDGKLLEIVGNHLTNEAGIYLIDPGDDGHTISLSSSLNAGSFKMFNPQPEPPAVLFEMNASTETGATFNIYDDIGQVMGFEPTPFNQGYSIKLIDPGDDGKLLELIGNHSTNEAGIYLIDPGDDGHTISLTSSLNAGSFKMFNPQPEPPAVLFEVNATSTNGATLNIYDEIGQVMGFEPMPFNSGYSINLIDPGDDGKLVEISSYYEAGQGSGKLSVFDDFLMLESHLEPGKLTLKYKSMGIEGPPIYMNTSLTNAQIGIGTSTPTEALYVLGNIYASGSITELSDESVKSNIETIDNALDLVDKLRGVRYNLHSDIADELNTTDDRQVGLIAQEVEQVIPEVVNSPKEGYKSLDYARLTAVLVEAVKELKAENDQLKTRIDALEHK